MSRDPALHRLPLKHCFGLLSAAGMIAAAPNMALAQAVATQADRDVASKSDAKEKADSGDIVVTATRRSESVLNVPLSISASSQETLDRKGIKDIADLTRSTAGLTFTAGVNGSSNIAIRGVSSVVGAGTTGVYIDDTPIQVRLVGASFAATNAYPSIFDLDRVEVLRGPQGTLFGAGSEGGTVRFISPAASLTRYSGYGRAEVSTTEGGGLSHEIGAAVGGPIVNDRVGFRISGFERIDGGWVDRVPLNGGPSEENSNSVQTIVLRGALKVRPFDNVTLSPSIYYQNIRRHDSGSYFSTLSNASNGLYVNGSAQRQPAKDEFVLYSLPIEIDAGGVSIFSNTSYFDRSTPQTADYTSFVSLLLGGPYETPFQLGAISTADLFNAQKSFSQEVRIQSNPNDGPFSWVIGGFYQRSSQRADQVIRSPNLDSLTNELYGLSVADTLGQDLIQPGSIVYFGNDRTTDEQIAGFGQVDVKLARRLKLTFGIRVGETTFSFSNRQGGAFNGGDSGSSGRQSEVPVTPRFGVEFKPDDNTLLYASAAKGYRQGGGNTSISAAQCAADLGDLGLTQAPTSYQSDSLWSYELGGKGQFFGRKLTIEGSAFYVDWQNIQNTVPLTNCGFQFIANLGNATSKGFDLHASVKPLKGLILEASASYVDAKYGSTILGSTTASGDRGVIVAKNDPLSSVPWHVSLGAEYGFALGPGSSSEAYVRADYDYNAGYTVGNGPSTVSYDPLSYRLDATSYVYMRAGVRRGIFDVSIFVNNLLNSRSVTSNIHDTFDSGLLNLTGLRPREVGATASMRF